MLQRASYPDIVPVILPLAPAEAFKRADAVATAMGLDVVARAPADGRLEAVATSPWFGFREDIVVRIRPDGAGSKIASAPRAAPETPTSASTPAASASSSRG